MSSYSFQDPPTIIVGGFHFYAQLKIFRPFYQYIVGADPCVCPQNIVNIYRVSKSRKSIKSKDALYIQNKRCVILNLFQNLCAFA